jgi:hypothetical protein
MTQSFGFGTGVVWATPTTDAYGNAIAIPQPQLLGVLQDISIDFSQDTKELYGTQAFALEVAAGKAKIQGKAKWAQISMQNIASIFFGQPFTSAVLSDYSDTIGSVIPTTPFTVTPTAPNSGTWTVDLGVRDVNGNQFTKVAAAPATGQYSVSGVGIYLFAAADVGKTVFISYQYTGTSTQAKTATFMNTPIGTKPRFRCDFTNGFQGNATTMTLFSCIATKFSFATKLDDYITQELDFNGLADPAGRVFQFGTSQ